MHQKKELFGTVAVRKGFATGREVEEALHYQRQIVQRGETHRLIGIIMLEQGTLGTTELIEILKELQPAGVSAPASEAH